MLIANASSADLITIGSRLVGVTFLWAAVIKAVAPHTFSRHLSALGWVPGKFSAAAVTVASGLEAALGTALIVNVAPGFLLPLTLIVLVALTGVAVWGVKSGKTTDCGCYGGYIQPSIGQSVGLNVLFALLVAAAWRAQSPSMVLSAWQVLAVALTGAAVGALAHSSQQYRMKHGRSMIETSPLRVGRRWKHSSAGGATAHLQGEVFVSYLGVDCPHCTRWVKVLNAMHQSFSLPAVVGVMTASGDELQSYIAEKGVRFPIATVSHTLMGRLTQAVPSTVLINEGKITDLWEGTAPPEFVDRFRRAFFPDVPQPLAEGNGKSGVADQPSVRAV